MRRRSGARALVLAVVATALQPARPAAAEEYILLSSAFSGGLNGAAYRTRVRLLNQGTNPVTVNARFFDQSSGSTHDAPPLVVRGRDQVSLENAIPTLFARQLGAYGPILFETSAPLVIGSTVSNVNACQTGAASGQWLPAIPPDQAMLAGAIGQLIVSEKRDSGDRTNIVFVNPGEETATVTVKIHRGGSVAVLAVRTLEPMGPRGFRQLPLDAAEFPGLRGTTAENVWIEFSSDRPVLSYATVINNMSGDPYAVLAAPDSPPAAEDPDEVTYVLPGGVPLVLVRIRSGTFQMGSPAGEPGRVNMNELLHPVTLSSDYYIGKFEVTQAQWQAVMGSNPTWFPSCGGDCAVDRVSWDDVAGPGGFLERLRVLLGEPRFRMPTEAEWERATRGGTQTRFFFGNALDSPDSCGLPSAREYMWTCEGGSPHPVGMKKPNPFGLYDVHGNVFEWVEDWFEPWASMSPQTDPKGPPTGTHKILRGGGTNSSMSWSRSAFRYPYLRNAGPIWAGFRLARSK